MIEHYCVIRGHKLNKIETKDVYNETRKIFSDEFNHLTTYFALINKYGFVGMNEEIYSSDSKDMSNIITLSKKFNLSLIMMYFKPEILEDKKCAVNIPFYLPNIYDAFDKFEYAFYVHNGIMEVVEKETAYELYSEYMKDYKCEAIFNVSDFRWYIKNEIRNKKRGSRIEERLRDRSIHFRKHIKSAYDYYKEGLNRLDKVVKDEKSGWYFVDEKPDAYKEYINVQRELEILKSKSDEMNFDEWDDLYRKIDDKLDKICERLDDRIEFSHYFDYIRFLNIITVNSHYDLDSEYLILSKINEAGDKILKNIQRAIIAKNYEFENIGYEDYIKNIEKLLKKLNEHRRIIGRYYHDIEYDD